jgi:hypothetical protein
LDHSFSEFRNGCINQNRNGILRTHNRNGLLAAKLECTETIFFLHSCIVREGHLGTFSNAMVVLMANKARTKSQSTTQVLTRSVFGFLPSFSLSACSTLTRNKVLMNKKLKSLVLVKLPTLLGCQSSNRLWYNVLCTYRSLLIFGPMLLSHMCSLTHCFSISVTSLNHLFVSCLHSFWLCFAFYNQLQSSFCACTVRRKAIHDQSKTLMPLLNVSHMSAALVIIRHK